MVGTNAKNDTLTKRYFCVKMISEREVFFMNKRDEKMLKKMLDLIKASTAEEPSVCHYHCPDCGTLMEWEDEMEDGMVCPICGHSSSLPEFGFDGDLDEWERTVNPNWDDEEVDPDDPDWDKDLWDND